MRHDGTQWTDFEPLGPRQLSVIESNLASGSLRPQDAQLLIQEVKRAWTFAQALWEVMGTTYNADACKGGYEMVKEYSQTIEGFTPTGSVVRSSAV